MDQDTKETALRLSALQFAVEAIEFDEDAENTVALAEDFYKFLSPDKHTQGEVLDFSPPTTVH